MVEGGQHCVMTDERAVTDGDTALILETAAAVDKNIFSHRNVLTAVCVKGWEQAEGRVRQACQDILKKFPDFLGAVVGIVERAGDPAPPGADLCINSCASDPPSTVGPLFKCSKMCRDSLVISFLSNIYFR